MTDFTVVHNINADQWIRFVDSHPKGTIFHTPQMYEVFRRTPHYRPLALAAQNRDQEILGLLLAARIQTLPGPLGAISSRSVWYAEPLCRDTPQGVQALAALIREHDAIVQKQVLFAEVRPLYAAGSERRALEQCGYVYQDYMNYLIDLSRPNDELSRALDRECRRRIKLNRQKGLEVRDVTTPQGVDILYRFLSLTYSRARVPLAHKRLFANAVSVLQPRDQVRVFGAFFENRPVGACITLAYKDRVFAWHGGAERVRTVYPMEALTWNDVEWGRQHGYAIYDQGGAGWPDKPYGVRDFKAKFRGQLVSYGRYRKVYSPFKLALAERAYESLRRVVRPNKWKVEV